MYLKDYEMVIEPSNNAHVTHDKEFHWGILAAYFCVVAMTQVLWLNLVPLSSYIQQRYDVGELTIGLLLLSFPLLYVLLSLHSGAMIDRRGYRTSIIFGCAVTGLSSCVRSIDTDFIWLALGQVGIGAGQPYVINSISRLISSNFSARYIPLSMSIGTAGMLVGMALGLGVTGPIFEKFGWTTTMIAFGSFTFLVSALFFFVSRTNIESTFNLSKHLVTSSKARFFALLQNRSMASLCLIWFLAFGSFNGLTSWLDSILSQRGISNLDAGLIGASLIASGILGTLILPTLAVKFDKVRLCLIFSALSALAILWPLCAVGDPYIAGFLASLLGFFMLPSFPLVLTVSDNLAKGVDQGVATSLLMLFGNAGAVVMILLLPVVKQITLGWESSVVLMMLALSASLVLALKLPVDIFRAAKA